MPSQPAETQWPEKYAARFARFPESPWVLTGDEEAVSLALAFYETQADVQVEKLVPSSRLALLEEAVTELADELQERSERAGRLSRAGVDADATEGEELALDSVVIKLRSLLSQSKDQS